MHRRPVSMCSVPPEKPKQVLIVLRWVMWAARSQEAFFQWVCSGRQRGGGEYKGTIVVRESQYDEPGLFKAEFKRMLKYSRIACDVHRYQRVKLGGLLCRRATRRC
jgi:hypothetical protein